jgi:transposase
MLKYALGIDVSSKDLVCCISTIDQQQVVKVKATTTFANTINGFKELKQWIARHYRETTIPFVIVMEATGVYYESCALYLHQEGYTVSVVLPNKAKNYMQATGLKSKNDKIDAKGLSRMVAEQSLARWQPMSTFYFTLRSHTRQLQNLQETKTSVSNQLHAAESGIYQVKEVVRQLRDLIKALEKQIVKMEQAIAQHIASDKKVSEKAAKMYSIKGVGITTVAVILGETNGFGLIENCAQLVSYAGYDVVENQSGKRTGKTRISKHGNARIRRILHMPAFNMVKYQVGNFLSLYNRTLARHHIKMKSYVAIQKKLLILLYTLWKKDAVFVSNADVEQVLSSRSDFEEVQKNSPTKGRATQGKQTHDVSQFASSR